MSSSTPRGSTRPGHLVFPSVSQPEQPSHPSLAETDASTRLADYPIQFAWNGPPFLSLQDASLDDTLSPLVAHAPVREDLRKYLALDPTVVELAPSPPRGSIAEISLEHVQNPGLSAGSTASTSSGIDSSTTLTGSSSTLAGPPIRVVPFHPSQAQKRRRVGNGQAGIPRVRAKARVTSSRSNVLQTEAAPRISRKIDHRGRLVGTETTFGLGQILRTPAAQQDNNRARIVACERCHKNKWKCGPAETVYDPCERCMKLVISLYLRVQQARKPQVQPCIRVDILDLPLHRKGPTIRDDLHIWVQGKQRLLQHKDTSNTHVLFLTQGIGEGYENLLSVTVSRFEPQEGDRTTYFWTDPAGNARSMQVPPYFISNLELARHDIREYVTNVRSLYIASLLEDSSPLIRGTFQQALLHSAFNQSQLVSLALDYWVAARLIETQWRVVAGGVKIGLEPKNEPGHPWNGFTPVTPIMDSQLDDLVIRHLLEPLSNKFLQRLKAKMAERRRENWLDIYLALFIVLSNTGWTLKDMIANATWKGLKPGARGGTLTQGFMHGCKTMLAYFHFACAGAFPLTLAWDKSKTGDPQYHSLPADQIEYLQFVQKEVTREDKLTKWKDLDMYKDDGYWCYQLLSPDWRGNIPHKFPVDDFKEEDFLSSSTD